MKKFIFFGKTAEYPNLSYVESFMSGVITVGNIVIFGENAMHWAIQIWTKKFGIIVITLPLRCFGKYWGCHIYFSPNGTPWASTYYKSIWKEHKPSDEILAKIRKLNFGHNFDSEKFAIPLRTINDLNFYFKEDIQ